MTDDEKQLFYEVCKRYLNFIEYLKLTNKNHKLKPYLKSTLNYLDRRETIEMILSYVDNNIYEPIRLNADFLLFICHCYMQYVIDRDTNPEKIMKLIQDIKNDKFCDRKLRK